MRRTTPATPTLAPAGRQRASPCLCPPLKGVPRRCPEVALPAARILDAPIVDDLAPRSTGGVPPHGAPRPPAPRAAAATAAAPTALGHQARSPPPPRRVRPRKPLVSTPRLGPPATPRRPAPAAAGCHTPTAAGGRHRRGADLF